MENNIKNKVLLKVNDLSVGYDNKFIINNFNLELKENEFIAITGKSGTGKTTLLKTLLGEVPKYTGEFNSAPLLFSYMPQDDLLFPWLNIIDNITLYGKINGEKTKYQKLAEPLFETFELSGVQKKYPFELSGGMKQRASFLRAVLTPMKIMLLDEPFSALDDDTKEKIYDWFLKLRYELKLSGLLVTHDKNEAKRLCDRIIEL